VVALIAVAATLGVQQLFGDDDDDGSAADGPSTTAASVPESTAGPATHFEDGLHLVGRDVVAGRYIATGLSGGCAWERFADVETTEPLAAAESVVGQAIVDIAPQDAAFRSQSCGVWESYQPPTAPPATTISEGDWVVGDQIEPGTYQSDVATSTFCTWTHASGFTHAAQEVILSHTTPYLGTDPPAVVELQPGERFTTQHCDPWTLIP
jgi:hypothetical protein